MPVTRSAGHQQLVEYIALRKWQGDIWPYNPPHGSALRATQESRRDEGGRGTIDRNASRTDENRNWDWDWDWELKP